MKYLLLATSGHLSAQFCNKNEKAAEVKLFQESVNMTKHRKPFAGCFVIAAAILVILVAPAAADWTEARCDVYPAGEDRTDKVMHCTFSQRQGYITITREDGVTHDLQPVGDAPGNFRDQYGDAVYRQSGLGDQGLIFRFPEESVFVYWSTVGLEPEEEDNPTAPFSTADYDATTLMRCRSVRESAFASCPAGILRMEGGRASIVVQGRSGEVFTINFMRGYINASNRDVEASLTDDTWTVIINGKEEYQVPLAALEGG